jgi:hypothetical protein
MSRNCLDLPRPESGPASIFFEAYPVPAPTCPDQRRGRRRPSSGVLRVLLGIGGGLRNYERRRIIANPPKPMARSERADDKKLLRTIYTEESLVVFSYVLLQLV